MPSTALKWWRSDAKNALDDMLAVHRSVGGRGPGRRYATAQVNNLYAVLLSSQFQNFCRRLHSEASISFANAIPAIARSAVLLRFTVGRKLETGNPNAGNIGSDFGWFGLKFWDVVKASPKYRTTDLERLRHLNLWRNAISHHDFAGDDFVSAGFGGRVSLRLHEVTRWRQACSQLAEIFDQVVEAQLFNLTASPPW